MTPQQREQIEGTLRRARLDLTRCGWRDTAGGTLRAIDAALAILAQQETPSPALCECRKALAEMVIRFTGLFDAYTRPTYAASSNPDDDLNTALASARAALASPCSCSGESA